MRLLDKVAVVAGAGYRVSDAIAGRLVEEGACVVLGGEDPNALLRTSGELYGWPPASHTLVVMDADDPQSAEDLVNAAVQAYGHIDIAVAAWQGGPAGAVYLDRAAGEVMALQGYGHIVNVSSCDEVAALTQTLASELTAQGVAMNCVMCGDSPADTAEATLRFAVEGKVPSLSLV